MIKYVTGNIFESQAQCLVNTVNCEGYMGKGIAYQFKLRYPENNKDYVRACKSGKLHIGTIHYFTEEGIWIVNFPTKDKWREKSRISYVEVGLDRLVEFIRDKRPASVAVPPLGCGNGGLDWNEVKGIINDKLAPVKEECDISVFEPSVSYRAVPKEAPQVSVSGLVLLQTRMQLQKFDKIRLQKSSFMLNYFLGEEYFKFDKWNYGPYSHSLDIIARSLGEYQKYYNLTNSEDTYKQLYNVICSKKTEDKMSRLLPAIEKATRYVNKITTDKKLEGVTTVLFLVQQNDKCLDDDTIVAKFKAWSEDKAQRFSEKYIRECIAYLEETGIILKNICGLYEISYMYE
jgi:O-acetyl-ADP-ribose deacetylase (regulator of RNase III)